MAEAVLVAGTGRLRAPRLPASSLRGVTKKRVTDAVPSVEPRAARSTGA